MNFNLLDYAEYYVGILKKQKKKKNKTKKKKKGKKNEEGTQFFNVDRSKRGIWFLKKRI